MKTYDVIVIGAGPSGMMAAITSAQYGKKVLLIDRNDVIGKKMRLTGGGRCNITNFKDTKEFIDNLPTPNGRFLYSSLSNFNPRDIYQYFETRNVPLKVEKDQKVFPQSNRSTDFIQALQKEMSTYEVTIKLETEVFDLEVKDHLKNVITNKGVYTAPDVVIATGGKSYPHTGSTGIGHILAQKFNHDITSLFPTESPVLSSDPLIISKELQGLSFTDVKLTLVDDKGKEIKHHIHDLIITHFGLSGPAALKLSQFIYYYLEDHKDATLYLDTLPDVLFNDLVEKIKELKQDSPTKLVKNALSSFSQNRLIEYTLKQMEINEDMKMAHLSTNQIETFVTYLKQFQIIVHGIKPIQSAFVTGGGVSLKQVDPKTMESKLVKGIYFTGEVLDLHGYTGGYNITIALSTGYTAGMSIGLSY